MAIVIIRLIIIIIDTKQYDDMILVPFGEPLGASVGSWRGPGEPQGGSPGGSGVVLGRPVGGPGPSWSDLGGRLAAT